MENEQTPAVNEEAVVEAAEAPKKATRTRRKAVPKAAEAAPVNDAAEAEPATDAAPEPKAPVRRTRARKKVEPAEPLPAFAAEVLEAPTPLLPRLS
ncbi:ribonuclease [Arthrobacter sp. Hiyo4]|nr:ribonuclease [Arthrobacter sp. Hiyo4]